jgi:GT2 family glycosyltransferase
VTAGATRGGLVWIVVLNWNGWRDTVECVESCRKLEYAPRRILVVDNGSTDGSEERLRNAWPDVDFVQTGANLGYAGGNNAGIRHALARGAAAVWLLNNDARVAPDCLTHMVAALDADARTGVVGSKVYYLDRPRVIASAGGSIDLRAGGATRHLGKDTPDRGAFDAPATVDYVPGCSMLVRAEAFATVGLLDESYFLYFEDADFCLRARAAGFTVRYEPRAVVWHREGAQADGVYSRTFVYYFLRNRLYFVKRFAPGAMWRCHWLQLRMLLFFVGQSARQGPRAMARMAWLGVRSYGDFYLSRTMGPSPLVGDAGTRAPELPAPSRR